MGTDTKKEDMIWQTAQQVYDRWVVLVLEEIRPPLGIAAALFGISKTDVVGSA